jgi:hypothetical protein
MKETEIFIHHEGFNIPQAEQLNLPEGRRYVSPTTGEKYISVTTLLDSGDKTWLENWRKFVGEKEADRIVRCSSQRGQEMHDMCERYLNNDPNPEKGIIDYNAKSFFKKIKVQLDKHVDLVYGTELVLYSDKLKLAGTTDLACVWAGRNVIGDFKNARKVRKKENIDDYFLQTTAYSMMFEEHTGIKCEDLLILMGVEGEDKLSIFYEKRSNWEDKLMQLIENNQ